MQAIRTVYLGPTNVRGSRVKASAAAGSITMDWVDAMNSGANHQIAAWALAAKLGWKGRWIGGGIETKSDSFMVWVLDDTQDQFTVADHDVAT